MINERQVMPWDDNTNGGSNGGGRSGGGGGGGPWGQVPGGGGPRRPGGPTPNLEDILSRGRDQFQGGLPGGRWLVLGAIVVAAVFWIWMSLYQVASDELGVEFRLGAPKEQLSQEGLHFLFWPVETVEKVSIRENQTRIASTGARNPESQMLTGDQNIVDVAFSILWRVNDPNNFIINVRGPQEMVRAAAESAMREIVGRRPAQDIFRDDRAGIETEVQEITQSILDNYRAGVVISEIAIENVAPPAEVADAFDEVQRAEQDEDRFQEQAREFANTRLGAARGAAAQLREEASAYQSRVVQEATGEAQRFVLVYEEYAKAPEVTRKRLFLETMEEVLSSSQKVVVESGTGSGVVPYLPLPEIERRASSGESQQ